MKIILFLTEMPCFSCFMKYKFLVKFEWCSEKIGNENEFWKNPYILKMVLGNYHCLFWCNVSVKECTWETTVRAREVKWGHQKGKTNHTGLEWNWTKNKWVSFFMPSLKIHADENKLGVFLIDF